jgi:hypothetical protein
MGSKQADTFVSFPRGLVRDVSPLGNRNIPRPNGQALQVCVGGGALEMRRRKGGHREEGYCWPRIVNPHVAVAHHVVGISSTTATSIIRHHRYRHRPPLLLHHHHHHHHHYHHHRHHFQHPSFPAAGGADAGELLSGHGRRVADAGVREGGQPRHLRAHRRHAPQPGEGFSRKVNQTPLSYIL